MAITINPIRCPQNHPCPLLRVCPTGAISQFSYKLPIIDKEKCIDCGKCTKYCGMGAVSKN